MKLKVSRICPKSIKEIKTMEMRMKMKVKTMKINVSRICPKSVTGMKTFQKRMKLKLFISLEGELLLRPAGP